ncbi:MAG: hypothetical protein NVS1B10_03720 [Candidatus Saccharimonadales bacterium]
MTTDKTSFEQILRRSGYSLTKQRRLIFELLSGQEPLSIQELNRRTNKQLDQASVYRIISVFERLGIVKRVNIGWKYKIELSDKFAEHHHHLSCSKCHKVIPINEAELESFIKRLAKTHNFTASEHQVEIQGYCSRCQQV